jgi:hypothetical protein
MPVLAVTTKKETMAKASMGDTPLCKKPLFLCAHPATSFVFRGHATVLAFSPLHLFRQGSPVLRRLFEIGL